MEGVEAVVRCCGPEPSFTPDPVKSVVTRVLGNVGLKRSVVTDEAPKLALPENLKSVS